MVWACGKNGRVLDGQVGVDGGRKCRACMMETDFILAGWCEGGLAQPRNDGGGCVTMREGS